VVEKERINLVFVGHVDHGKSTLVGRLLLDTGSLDSRVIEKYKEEAAKIGKATFEFAWVMDKRKDERERGVTIDATHLNFETKNKKIFIIDAPGHKDFIKNMITGTSEADAAVLVVDVNDTFERGIMEQTKEHAMLAKTMGVEQIIVVVNKLDKIKYDREIFNKVSEDIKELLKKYGWDVEKIPIVPVSAYNGDNVVNRSDKLSWYKGPTFLEVLDALKPTRKQTDKPFRMPIDDFYKISGVGTVVAGVVSSGKVKVGDKLIIQPIGIITEVKSIEEYHKPKKVAIAGDDVGINLRGVDIKKIKKGYVLGHVENPPSVAYEFLAKVIIMNHPRGVYPGYTPIFHISTQHVPCTFIELISKIDPKTGEESEKNPEMLKSGDIAIVKIRPTRPIVIEEADKFPRLSRFAIRDIGQTIGAGMCIKITGGDSL